MKEGTWILYGKALPNGIREDDWKEKYLRVAEGLSFTNKPEISDRSG